MAFCGYGRGEVTCPITAEREVANGSANGNCAYAELARQLFDARQAQSRRIVSVHDSRTQFVSDRLIQKAAAGG